jgi:uncharacterized protein (TIGR03435 family)
MFGLILSCVAAFGEASNETARFEVASVKFRPGGAGLRTTGLPVPLRDFRGLLTYEDVTLKGVVMRAYGAGSYTIVAPRWMEENRYDIVARAPAGASAAQVPAMLQNLLAERFKMQVHWESREMATYALVVGKGGPKLTAAKTSPPDGAESGGLKISLSDPVQFNFKAASMDVLARELWHWLGRPVLNMTDLAGCFDISITASQESMPGLPDSDDANASSSPSIFDALKTLGLALEPRRDPVRFLVIDSAQKMPTPN